MRWAGRQARGSPQCRARLLTRQAPAGSPVITSPAAVSSWTPSPIRSSAASAADRGWGRGHTCSSRSSPAPQEQQAPPSLFPVSFLACLSEEDLEEAERSSSPPRWLPGSLLPGISGLSPAGRRLPPGRGSEGTGNPRPAAWGWRAAGTEAPWGSRTGGVSLSAWKVLGMCVQGCVPGGGDRHGVSHTPG